jgi:hypothetical protein
MAIDPKRAADEITMIEGIMDTLRNKMKQRPDQWSMLNHMLITLSAICTALYNL